MKIFPKKSNWFYPLITLVILLLPFAVLAQFAEDMDTVEIYSDGVALGTDFPRIRMFNISTTNENAMAK